MGNYFKKMSNKIRDESFSIDLPLSNLVLTRYLYLKDEVKLALLISLLNKSDDAIFWAYELYYSGFKMELYDYIWKIYYDFFATLNPCFEQYLNKMLKTNHNNTDDSAKLVATIVQDLLIRPFNTDVFFLRTICSLFEIECSLINTNKNTNTSKKSDINKLFKSTSNLHDQLTNWIDIKDFKSIAQFILNVITFDTNLGDKVLYTIYSIVIDIFTNIYNVKMSKPKLLKEFGLAQDRINSNINIHTISDKKVVLLTKIITLFALKEKLVKGKNFYIIVEPEDIIQYETIESSIDLRHYKVLDVARICGIDDLKYLSLFRLERDTLFKNKDRNEINENGTNDTIKELYLNNWLYHAAFSPIWFNRIKMYRGYVDYKNQKVEFVDEDVMQLFYNKYGYEPDEQSQNITDKFLKINKGINWSTFYNNFKTNGLFMLDEDELDELNNDKIKY
jgi:hypothetical protein